jgi:hypothetical protein
MSEKYTRRIDLDRPQINLPCNGRSLPQQVGFQNESGTEFTVSLEGAIAFGLIKVGEIIEEEISSRKYIPIVLDKFFKKS